jgi:hypothetical protein
MKSKNSNLTYTLLVILALALGVGATRSLKAQTPPYWDGSPSTPCCWTGFSKPQVQGGVVFVLATAAPDLGLGVLRWTQCDGWQTIGTFGKPPTPEGYVPHSYLDSSCLSGNYLYVGGEFNEVQGVAGSASVAATNIARYNLTTGQWSPVGNPTPTKAVEAIAVDSLQNVYAGFATHDTALPRHLNPEMLQVWNGSSWSPVGGGLFVSTHATYPNGISALAASGTNIYVAGDFDGSSTTDSYELIKWTGSAWVAMVPNYTFWNGWRQPDGSWRYGYNHPDITSIAISGANVFIAGDFRGNVRDAGLPTDGTYESPVGVARFNTSGTYQPDSEGLISGVSGDHAGIGSGLAVQNGIVYLSGSFDTIGDLASQTGVSVQGFAQWNGGSWSPVGAGLVDTTYGYADGWFGTAADADAVYVFGNFNQAGSVPAAGGARWVTSANPLHCGAPLLNIDFCSVPVSPEVGPAALGQAGDFWNTYTSRDANNNPRYGGTVSNLKLADGTVTSTILTVANAPGNWANSSDDIMYFGYIYPWNGGNVTVTLAQLDPGTYDFYMYAHDGKDQITVNGVTYGPVVNTTVQYPAVNPVVWQEGRQYVVIRAVPVATGQTVTLTVLPGIQGYAIISGMQIAKHP